MSNNGFALLDNGRRDGSMFHVEHRPLHPISAYKGVSPNPRRVTWRKWEAFFEQNPGMSVAEAMRRCGKSRIAVVSWGAYLNYPFTPSKIGRPYATDWDAVADWKRPDRVIAAELGRSRQAVYRERIRRFGRRRRKYTKSRKAKT